MQKETSRTRNTFALVLHRLHRSILLLLRLYHPGTKSLLLLLVCLALSLHLGSTEIKLCLQGAYLRRQLFLVFGQEKEASMILRKRLNKKREREKA